MMRRACRVMFGWALAALLVAGCGHETRHPARSSRSPPATGSRSTAGSAHAHGAVLRVVRRGSLPTGVQAPALAVVGGRVLAIGGLDATDASSADVLELAPGRPRVAGRLPAPVHDIGAATLGDSAFAFGGGTASGPIDAITRVRSDARTRTVGRLPVPMSDTAATGSRGTIYVVGGYTVTTPLRSVLAYRPGRPLRQVATLPHPLRYPAVAAAAGRVLVAGGTDGTRARREVLEIDPASHRVRVIARLPSVVAHAAGAVLDGTFYVLGGRGDTPNSQRATIWAVDLASHRLRRAGRLPRPLSDLAAVTVGHRIIVAGDATRAAPRPASCGRWRRALAASRRRPRCELVASRRCWTGATCTPPGVPAGSRRACATTRRACTCRTRARTRST